jgi:ketosteroid isomerase-like protein
MDREGVAGWVAGYERAWRSPGVESLAELFSADAGYLQNPYGTPVTGLAEIGRMWERERDGPDEPFTMASEIVAVDGDTAVVRVEVRYQAPRAREFRDLWVIRFGGDGRCRWFEEWPFSPRRRSPA